MLKQNFRYGIVKFSLRNINGDIISIMLWEISNHEIDILCRGCEWVAYDISEGFFNERK